MQFRKISDTKIRCEISQEEMWEKGIEIDDFLDHREKTEEFLREVLAEAKYELDLEDMGHFFSVQMSVKPEGGLSLLISGEQHQSQDAEKALEEFGKHLQDFKAIMSEAKKKLEEEKRAKNEAAEEGTSEQEKAGQMTELVKSIPIWARLKDLESCIVLSKRLAADENIVSTLYKYNDEYYLRIAFMKEAEHVAGTILMLSEYVEEIVAESQGGELLKEHGTVVCQDNAVQVLAEL